MSRATAPRMTRATWRAKEQYAPAVQLLVRAGFGRRLLEDPDEWAIRRALELLAAEVELDPDDARAVHLVLARQPQSLRHFCLNHPDWLRSLVEAAR